MMWWTHGNAVCVECGHRWVSVRPLITDALALECPNCGEASGIDDAAQIDASGGDWE